MREPEFSFDKIRLRGKDAIRAAGWSLRLLIVAKAIALVTPLGAVIAYVAMRLWLN